LAGKSVPLVSVGWDLETVGSIVEDSFGFAGLCWISESALSLFKKQMIVRTMPGQLTIYQLASAVNT
jgi:hypothetical protein